MRRALMMAMLALTLVVGVTVAEAAQKGSYKGKTSASDPVGMKVDGKNRVYSFYYEGVRLECTDGDSLDTPTGRDRIQVPARFRFPVNSSRRFKIRARNASTGFGWDARGRFNRRGNRASGTLSVFATFNENNEQDPNGSIRCESGQLSFSARRR